MRQNWQTRLMRGPSGREIQVDISSIPKDLQLQYFQARAASRPSIARHPESLAALDGMRPAAKDRALVKLEILELAAQDLIEHDFTHGRRTEALRTWLSDVNTGRLHPGLTERAGGPISFRTFYRWQKYSQVKGTIGLADKRGRPKGARLTPEQKSFIEDAVYSRPHITAAKIHRLMLFRFAGEHIPALRTLREIVAKIKQENKARLIFLSQPSIFKRWYQISLGRADNGLTEPNERWEIDSTRADIMCSDGKRATAILIKDVFTRRPVWGIFEKGGGHQIGQTLFKALSRLGIPRQIIMDLGKDYQSREVQLLCADLGIDCPKIPGYSPELKPHAEIGFNDMAQDLLSILTGYTSNKLSTRSEEIKTRYTLAEVQELADKWMVDYENNHVHSGIGQTPMQRWNSSLEAGWRPDMVDRECLFILLKPAEPRKISKGRINFNGGIFTSPDLDYLDQAATVFVRPDPENAGLLYVFDHDQIFLTIAQDLQRLNLTPKEITTRKKQWWKIRRDERRATLARAALLDMDALERERLDAAVAEAKRREGPTVEPNIIRIPEIEKAAEARAVALGEKEPPVPEREARPAPADPNARPEFDDPDLRYEWIAQQLGRGGEIDKRDQAFAEHYERTSKYFEWMGGADYKARLMGRKIAAAN